MSTAHAARAILAHPLVLLLAGAILSSLVVPVLSRESQKSHQALEIRRDLAERMSSAVSPFLAATLSNELVWRGKPNTSYDRAYERWSTESDVILTRMRTYLDDRDRTIAAAWSGYQSEVRWLYYLFKVGATPEESRRIILRDYIGSFLRRHGGVDVATLAAFHVPDKGINPSLDGELRRLLVIYRLEEETLIDRVLASAVQL